MSIANKGITMSVNSVMPQTVTLPQQQCQCKCQCCSSGNLQQPTDTIDLSSQKTGFFVKASNAVKKTVKFVKENANPTKALIVGAGKGLLTACTILGASQLIDAMTKTNTKNLSPILATIAGIGITAQNFIKAKKDQKVAEIAIRKQ